MAQFLDSEKWEEGADNLSALSTPGNAGYKGLERISVRSRSVVLTSDEVTALCPVTGQPDFYTVEIEIIGGYSIESKSLKLYFVTLRNVGMFCEDLSRKIKQDVEECIVGDDDPSDYADQVAVDVTVIQKPRGGISIEARS